MTTEEEREEPDTADRRTTAAELTAGWLIVLAAIALLVSGLIVLADR